MIKKITLQSVNISGTKKDGTKYTNKSGAPYEMATIKFDNTYASKYVDSKFGLKFKEMFLKWKEGEEVLIKLEKNGDFTNFDIPSKTDLLEAKVEHLEESFRKIQDFLREKFK